MSTLEAQWPDGLHGNPIKRQLFIITVRIASVPGLQTGQADPSGLGPDPDPRLRRVRRPTGTSR